MTLVVEGVILAGRLDGADCTLQPGTITAVCGPNGAGKSTLLAVLAGLVAPDRGAVRLDGRALGDFAPRERAQAIGYLPQARDIAWDIDVATLAGLGRLPWRAAPRDDEAAVAAALATLDLTDLARRPVSRLSGGEQARALLARVLAGEPRWILADEPFAALDLAHQTTLMRHLRALADRGIGVAVVVHDLAMAMNGADHAIALDSGTVVAAGSPAEVLAPDRLAMTWGVTGEWLRGQHGYALAVTGGARPGGTEPTR